MSPYERIFPGKTHRASRSPRRGDLSRGRVMLSGALGFVRCARSRAVLGVRETLHRLSQIPLVGDVVAAEHARGPVSEEFHCYGLIHAGANQVPGGVAPEVVDE